MTTPSLFGCADDIFALRAVLNAIIKDGSLREWVDPGMYSNEVSIRLSYDNMKVGEPKPRAGRIAWKPVAMAAIKRLNADSVAALVKEIQLGVSIEPKRVTREEVKMLPRESMAAKYFTIEDNLLGPAKMVDGSVYTPKSYSLSVHGIGALSKGERYQLKVG